MVHRRTINKRIMLASLLLASAVRASVTKYDGFSVPGSASGTSLLSGRFIRNPQYPTQFLVASASSEYTPPKYHGEFGQGQPIRETRIISIDIQYSSYVCNGDGSGAQAPSVTPNANMGYSIISLGEPYAVSQPVGYILDATDQPYGFLVQSSSGYIALATHPSYVAPVSESFAPLGTIPSGNNGRVTTPIAVRDPTLNKNPRFAVVSYTTYGEKNTWLTNGSAILRLEMLNTTALSAQTGSADKVPVPSMWAIDLLACSSTTGSPGSQCGLEFAVSDPVGVLNASTKVSDMKSVRIATTFGGVENGTDPSTGRPQRVTRASAIGVDPWSGEAAWRRNASSLVEPQFLRSNSSVYMSAFNTAAYTAPQTPLAGGDAVSNGRAVPLCASLSRTGLPGLGEPEFVSRVVCLSHEDGGLMAQSDWVPRTAAQKGQGKQFTCTSSVPAVASRPERIRVGGVDIFVVLDSCGNMYGVKQPTGSAADSRRAVAAPATLDVLWIQRQVQNIDNSVYGIQFTTTYIASPGLVAVDSSVNPKNVGPQGLVRGSSSSLGNDYSTLMAFVAVTNSNLEPFESKLQGLAILIPNAGRAAQPYPELTDDARTRIRSVLLDPAVPASPTDDDDEWPAQPSPAIRALAGETNDDTSLVPRVRSPEELHSLLEEHYDTLKGESGEAAVPTSGDAAWRVLHDVVSKQVGRAARAMRAAMVHRRDASVHDLGGGPKWQMAASASQNAIIHPTCNDGRHVLVSAVMNMPPGVVIVPGTVGSMVVAAMVDLSAPRACMYTKQTGESQLDMCWTCAYEPGCGFCGGDALDSGMGGSLPCYPTLSQQSWPVAPFQCSPLSPPPAQGPGVPLADRFLAGNNSLALTFCNGGYVPDPSPLPSPSTSPSGPSKPTNPGLIIGGSVAGAVVVVGLGLGLFYMLRGARAGASADPINASGESGQQTYHAMEYLGSQLE